MKQPLVLGAFVCVVAEMTFGIGFTAIDVTPSNVSCAVGWSNEELSTNATVDVFVAYPTLTNTWRWIDGLTIQGPQTNALFCIDGDSLGVSNLPSGMFVAVHDRSKFLTNMGDFDGDGMPNCYELYHGTNPYVPDSDAVPRITVGQDGDYSSIPAALAASTEYAVIEVRRPESSDDNIAMPPHPVMLIGPTNGYAFIRSRAQPYVFALNQGQDERTVFRNLYVELLPSSALQVGFWCGGSNPSGVGGGSPAASATFQSIYLKACEGCSYGFGWMMRDWKDSQITLDRCVINPGGARRFIGVSAIDTAELIITNCTFVNFPPLDSTHYGVGVQVERIATTNAMSVSIGSCVFDESFTNAYPLGRLGTGCAISSYNTIIPSTYRNGHSPDVEVGTVYASNVVISTGHPVENGLAAQMGTGALAALGAASSLDSDIDGLPDWQETFQYSTDPFRSDSDGDKILDGVEIAHATNPNDASEYCFAATFVISNRFASSPYTMASYADVLCRLTNVETVLSAHVMVTNATLPQLIVFNDFDGSGGYTEGEPHRVYGYVVNSHSFTNCFMAEDSLSDSDGDEIPDWWEIHHGLCATNAADALADIDGDGLLNIHEYWAGCDPHAYDGTNTALYAAVHGVDDRLPVGDVASTCVYYSDATAAYLMETNIGCASLTVNTNCWMKDVDISCLSICSSTHDPDHPWPLVATLISPWHVITASHVVQSNGAQYVFQSALGETFVRTLVRSTVLSGVAENDICVGILNSPLPDAIRPVRMLPSDYERWIGDGRGLPLVRIGRDKSCNIFDVEYLAPSAGHERMIKLKYSSDMRRSRFGRGPLALDSGNPIFLLFEEDVVFLCPTRGYYPDEGLATGYLCSSYLNLLQKAMNELSEGQDAPQCELLTFPMGAFP